ncbi:MAG: hypothetical protein GC162_01285 [Planctomycetes bacterium]|nr:hypothetical protein [Planctomycetota bacterium]
MIIDETTARLIGAYVDGELTDAQRERARQLIASDPAASAYAASLMEIGMAIEGLPRLSMSPQALEMVYDRIDRLGDVVIARINRWAVGIAASILVLCSVALVSQSQGSAVTPAAAVESYALIPAGSDAAAETDAGAGNPEARMTQWMVSELSEEGEP